MVTRNMHEGQPKFTISHCSVCWQKPSGPYGLCPACSKLLIPPLQSRCERCALPLGTSGLCGECQQHSPSFDHVYCLSDYQWPYDMLIKQYKYHHQSYLARPLAYLLYQQLTRQQVALPEALVAVPMHWWKQWRRGFNQSDLLTQQLAQHTKLPISAVLQRHRLGSNQASLSAKARRRVLNNSFRQYQPCPYQHIALVDDVVTTASTANVLAKLLKQNGVDRVDVWALTRTDKPNHR